MFPVIISLSLVAIAHFFTISNSIFGGDAGDLVSAIITKGFPHPPGYPFYTSLGIFFNSLPFHLSSAGKITLISTFSTFFSLIIFTLIIKEIASPKYSHYAIISIIIYIIGFNYLVWFYSVVPETFPLNTAIILCLFYFTIKWYKTLKKKFIYLVFFFIGLGISHHHTFLVVMPSIMYIFYCKRKKLHLKNKEYVRLFLYFLTGILPLSYLIFSRQSNSEIVWGNTNTISGFLSVLMRTEYGSFVAGPFVSNIAYNRFLQLKNLFLFTVNDFTMLGVILTGVGLIFFFTLKKSDTKTLLTALLMNIFLYGPFFLFYANFPLVSDIFLATIERYFIIYYFFFAVLLYFGIYWIYALCNQYVINRLFDKTHFKKIINILLLIIMCILPFQLFMENKRLIDPLKNDRTAENFGNDILRIGEKNVLLLAISDTVLFNTQYMYYTYPHLRKEITFINPFRFKIHNDYAKIIHVHYPKLRITPFNPNESNWLAAITTHIILPNIKVFNSIYSDHPYPLESTKEYTWIPYGMLYKLEKKTAIKDTKNIERSESFWQKSSSQHIIHELKKNNPSLQHFFTKEIINQYVAGHQQTAYYYLYLNQRLDYAARHIQDAIFLQPNNSYNYLLLSNYYFQMKQCSHATIALSKSASLKSNKNKYSAIFFSQLDAIGEQCYKDKKDKERIKKKIKELLESVSQPLEKF